MSSIGRDGKSRAHGAVGNIGGNPVVPLFLAHVGGEFAAEEFRPICGPRPDPDRVVVAGRGEVAPIGAKRQTVNCCCVAVEWWADRSAGVSAHTLIVPSLLPETIWCPSGLNATLSFPTRPAVVTRRVNATIGAPTGRPVSASDTRTVESSSAETMRRPSGLKATLATSRPGCQVRGAPICWPVSASHTRNVSSAPAETMRRPSGRNETLKTFLV